MSKLTPTNKSENIPSVISECLPAAMSKRQKPQLSPKERCGLKTAILEKAYSAIFTDSITNVSPSIFPVTVTL